MGLNWFEIVILVLCAILIFGLMNMFKMSEKIARKVVKKDSDDAA